MLGSKMLSNTSDISTEDHNGSPMPQSISSNSISPVAIHVNGRVADEEAQKPFIPSLEAMLAAEVPPDADIDDEIAQNSTLVEPDNTLISNLSTPDTQQNADEWYSEDQRRQEEEDSRRYVQFLINEHNSPKTPPKILKANDPAEIIARGVVHADPVKTPTRVKGDMSVLTPTGPRSYNRHRGLPRSPGTCNLLAYANGDKDYNPPETFGSGGRASDDNVFENRDERRDAIRHQKQVGGSRAPLSSLFQWGIKYNPTDASQDQGYRTIIIPVPPYYTLMMLIEDKLKGRGQIYHGQICETTSIKSTGGHNTATIIFVTQPEWIDNPEVLAQISVSLEYPAYKLESKTWPMSENMIANIAGGYTRCLVLMNAPDLAKLYTFELHHLLLDSMTSSPCYYPLDTAILVLKGDGIDKVYVVMNSITGAIGMLQWMQNEWRKFGDGFHQIEFEFCPDISMTDEQSADHIAFNSSRRRAAVDRPSPPRGDLNDNSPTDSSSPDSNDDQGSGTALTDNLDALIGRAQAYRPPQTSTPNPTAPKFSPGSKTFGFAPFPTIQGGFFPDGIPNDHRRDKFKRVPEPPKTDIDKSTQPAANFIYKDGKGAVPPQTPGPVQVPKMGLYEPKTGVNWADDDDDGDFGISYLSLKAQDEAPREGSAPTTSTAGQGGPSSAGMGYSISVVAQGEAPNAGPDSTTPAAGPGATGNAAPIAPPNSVTQPPDVTLHADKAGADALPYLYNGASGSAVADTDELSSLVRQVSRGKTALVRADPFVTTPPHPFPHIYSGNGISDTPPRAPSSMFNPLMHGQRRNSLIMAATLAPGTCDEQVSVAGFRLFEEEARMRLFELHWVEDDEGWGCLSAGYDIDADLLRLWCSLSDEKKAYFAQRAGERNDSVNVEDPSQEGSEEQSEQAS